MSKTKVSVVKVAQPEGNASFMGGKYIRIEEDVRKIEADVAEAVELAIGSLDTIIKEGDTVLIKPNLAFQAPPESHAVVDPRTIEAVVSYVKKNSKLSKILSDEYANYDSTNRYRSVNQKEFLLSLDYVINVNIQPLKYGKKIRVTYYSRLWAGFHLVFKSESDVSLFLLKYSSN